MGLNCCRTFISSISLTSELAGSNLIQTLLYPPQVLWHSSSLLNVSVTFTNEKKGKTITQLTRSNVEQEKRFYENRRFSAFPSFMVLWLDF